MAYKVSNYKDWDLKLKADRVPSSASGDAAVAYAQTALNDLGSTDLRGRPLRIDGQFGQLTGQSVLKFQKATGRALTGNLDQPTWNELDWRVYGKLSGAWRPASVTYTNTKPNGPAVLEGHNMYLIPSTKVAVNGQTREGQRLSDVIEAFHGRSTGYEGAVNRYQRGTTNLSRHALGLAGDDMGDQDKDRIIDPDEVVFCRQSWDYLFLRAQGFPAVPYQLRYVFNGAQVVKATAWRGRDRLSTMVLGNLRMPDGTLSFPGLARNRDVSWTAARNTPKGSSSTVHVAPYHLHTDAMPGAPEGSPF